MPTPNFNLPIYGPGDTAALDTLLNGQSSAIDAALLSTEWRAGGTAANRLALTPPRRKEGLQFYETDTNREWFYDGANWLIADGGCYKIRPTAVTGTGVSITSRGNVAFTAVAASTTCTIQGIFSSQFKTYRAQAYWTSKPVNQDAVVRGLIGTTVVNPTTYSRSQQFLVAGSRADSQVTGIDSFGSMFIPYWGTLGGATVDIVSPNEPAPTYTMANWTALGGVTLVGQLTGNLNSTDQLTGLQVITPAGAAITGEVAFYGFA